MPKSTEVEWQESSDSLAREVMGWTKWDDLPMAAQMAYLAILPRKPDPFRLGILRNSWWSVRNGCACIELLFTVDWQPHRNVAQAMLVLRTLLAKTGPHADAQLFMRPPPGRCRVTIQNWVAAGGIPAMFVRSPYADDEMHAICLAAERWLDAQKEE